MLWHDIFWARKDIESNLHRPVKLVHPSLTATKNNFLNSGGLMKLMHVCLCVRSNIKNSFQHWRSCDVLQAICVSGRMQKAVFMTVEVLQSLFTQFEYQEGSKAQFPPLWRSCEDVARHFQCNKRPRKQFLPLWRLGKARACHFRCWERHRKQSSQLLRSWKLMHACLCVQGHIKSSFHNCIGPVNLSLASLGVRINVESIFHHRGGLAKVQVLEH